MPPVKNSRDYAPIRYYAPRMPIVKKDHNQGRPFKNQDDNSTGKNTCHASTALAVRLRIIYTFSPYR